MTDVTSEFVKELSSVVGSVITEPAAMEAYRRDHCLLAADEAGMPLAVVRAASVDDVVATVDLCREHAVPLVTRGAGTGLAGSANALDGCVVLVVGGMDQIIEIDETARLARVQPGVINADLDAAAAERGLWYVPDPGSRAICSIGGNMATNAGGMCCAKYGVTRDHVAALTVVLGTGEVVHTGGRTRKNVAGLDLTQTIVGSEGTLGVIVEATVRLRPRPSHLGTVAATFPTIAAAAGVVEALRLDGDTAAMELMDRTTVAAVNAMGHMGLDEAGALLLVQYDDPDCGARAERAAKIATDHGAEAFHSADPEEGRALMEARRLAVPALERLGANLLDDVGVPPHRLVELVTRIEEIAERRGVVIGNFGHAADGNLHPTVIYDPMAAGKAADAAAAFEDVTVAALDLGGTITGEHGVGSIKTAYVERQVGAAEQALMRRIKAAFDPAGILNPGRAY